MFWPACPSSGNTKYKILGGLIATVGFRNRNEISKAYYMIKPPSI
jgi:hypothetical protein